MKSNGGFIGTLCFILYKDIVSEVYVSSNINLFADDMKILVNFSQLYNIP